MDEAALIARLEAVLADEKASTASVVRAAEVIARLKGWGAASKDDEVEPGVEYVDEDPADELAAKRRRLPSTGVR
jgi:hypothetical protein